MRGAGSGGGSGGCPEGDRLRRSQPQAVPAHLEALYVALLHQLQAWQSVQRDNPRASAVCFEIEPSPRAGALVPWSVPLLKEAAPPSHSWRSPPQT